MNTIQSHLAEMVAFTFDQEELRHLVTIMEDIRRTEDFAVMDKASRDRIIAMEYNFRQRLR